MKDVSPELMRFLSNAFAQELDAATIAACRHGVADQLLRDLPQADRLIEEMRTWSDTKQTQKTLATSYGSVFLSGGREAAPLYASAWQGNGTLMSAPHWRMQLLLKQAGKEVDTGFSEPADHLAVMLEYLAMCLERHHGTIDAAQFASEDILPWYYGFATKAHGHIWSTPFYQSLVSLTESVVEQCTLVPEEKK